MAQVPVELTAARERFMELVAELRPELHRYCARLVGSAIDGEDVVQEALAKACYALGVSRELPPLRPWLLRIAHNTAIDFLRRYDRRFVEPVGEVPDAAVTIDEPTEHPRALRVALASFVALPVLQRSAVILKDVLDYSLDEIAETLATTIPAVKAALVRGRRALGAQPVPETVPWRDRPGTTPGERVLLERYVALFNARDWDGLRALLADECALDVVARAQRKGKPDVGLYYGNYALEDVRLELGEAEGRTVLVAYRPEARTRPAYIIAIDWRGDRIAAIRDYRYVPYLIDELALE